MDIMKTISTMAQASAYPQQHQPAGGVVQHNEIVEACYSMTLNEKRLLVLAISKICDPYSLGYGNDHYEVTAKDWSVLFNTDQKLVYDDIKTAAEQLLNRTLHLKYDANSGIKMHWLSSYEYKDNQGTLKVRFTQDTLQYLVGLKEQFTRVDILQIADMNSFYTIRLYELLMQFKATGWRTMAVDELRRIMDCTDKYPKFSALRQWVIDPALEEINEKTNITAKLDVKYNGKKAVSLEFTFKPKNKKKQGTDSTGTRVKIKSPGEYVSTRDTSLHDDLHDTSWAE